MVFDDKMPTRSMIKKLGVTLFYKYGFIYLRIRLQQQINWSTVSGQLPALSLWGITKKSSQSQRFEQCTH